MRPGFSGGSFRGLFFVGVLTMSISSSNEITLIKGSAGSPIFLMISIFFSSVDWLGLSPRGPVLNFLNVVFFDRSRRN